MECRDRVLNDIGGGQGVVRIHVEAFTEQPAKIRSLHEVRRQDNKERYINIDVNISIGIKIGGGIRCKK